MHVSLSVFNENLILRFPFDRGLVSAVKSLPTSTRRWDGDLKAWIIDPAVGAQLLDLIETCTGDKMTLPAIQHVKTQTRILKIIYVGRCKDHDGEKLAFGMLETGDWSVLFPESTLRTWFDVEDEKEIPLNQSNLFAILGIRKTASAEEIKTGYRRMVKQWHPDINRNDPDATEQFRRIQEAWEILSIEKKRVRYLAGLQLQESIQLQENKLNREQQKLGYRPPLRCGYIMAEGTEKAGRFYVSNILAWQDIYNEMGQVMVVSWLVGDLQPVVSWL